MAQADIAMLNSGTLRADAIIEKGRDGAMQSTKLVKNLG